ncbi:MAG: hypothetical protein KJO07_14020, partial [Deltaproteobacteria bacterium]|nr:hypothetical protein [Deltaproteobacteria bacterium]
QLSTGEELLDADPARMEQLVADVVLPLLADSLESVPLAPALAPIEGLYVWIKDVGASGGWLRASFDLYSADPDDDIAPETELEDRSVVRAGLVSLKVTGYDNSTPEPLLRYRASLDGEPLKEAPYFAEQIRFNVEDGEHVLEVAAVDLNGNADPRPARVQLVVDGTPPLLDVLSAPGTFLPRGGAVSASWTSSDEREGVRSKWQIFALANNGLTGEVVAEGAAGSAGEMHVDDLNKNKLYVLRITAEDRAGNLTSEEFGFAFEQAGCRIADGGASDSAPLLLALALLAAGRRRRRR